MFTFSLPRNQTGLKKQALDLLSAGVNSVTPQAIFEEKIKLNQEILQITAPGGDFSLKLQDKRLFIISFGKSASYMTETLLEKLPRPVTGGVVVAPENHETSLSKNIEYIFGGHPYPNEKSVAGAQAALALKEKYQLTANDVIFCLISGGGSALFALPVPGITLKDKQKTTDLLLKCGANIQEINCARKHLSQVKGGQLARFFAPTPLVSLIISDVISNDLSVIASGPTFKDPSTYQEALGILEKYQISDRVPITVLDHLQKGAAGQLAETPKESIPSATNLLLGTNQSALEAMKTRAQKIPLTAQISDQPVSGEVSEAARLIVEEIVPSLKTESKNQPALAFLSGGEPTVKVDQKTGRGGRNQELALWVLYWINQNPEIKNLFFQFSWVFAALGTDGVDFVEEAAGGIVDHNSLKQIEAAGLNLKAQLDNHDSFPVLEKTDGLLAVAEPTKTNVGDLHCFLIKK